MRFVFRITVAIGLAAAMTPAGADTTNVRVNDTASGQTAPVCNSQSDPALARSGDRVVAVWHDVGRCEASPLGPRPRIPDVSLAGYAWSGNGGATWSDAGTLSPPPGGALLGPPAVAAGDGSFVAASAAVASDGRSFLAALRSTDGGQTFSAPVDVSGLRASSEAVQSDPAVAAGPGGRIALAWREYSQGLDGSSRMSVLFARSTDGGATFTEPELVSGFGHRAGSPDVAVGPAGEVYVTWMAGDTLWITRSFDGGATFSRPNAIGSVPEIGHLEACVLGGWRQVLNGRLAAEQDPSLAVDASAASSPRRGWLYVAIPAATRPGDEADVVVARSQDRGATWSAFVRVNDDATPTDQFNPQVAVDDRGTLGVAWYDRRLFGGAKPPNWRLHVFTATSSDGGTTFARNTRVTDVPHEPARAFPIPDAGNACTTPSRAALAGSGTGFVAAWGDNRAGSHAAPDVDVYAARV